MIKKSPYGGYSDRFYESAKAAKASKLTLTEHVKREREARERQAADYKEAFDAVRDAVTPQVDVEALAKAVIRAGQLRRGEIAPELPPADSTAAKILRQGRLRRGEETAEDQAERTKNLSPTALGILNAGRRRRNEPELK
jgi:hypothetical protein